MDDQPESNFWREVFSDGGQGSASRVLTGLHSAAAVGCLVYVTAHNHMLPDAVTMAGLGAFAGVHYALNQAKNAVSSFSGK